LKQVDDPPSLASAWKATLQRSSAGPSLCETAYFLIPASAASAAALSVFSQLKVSSVRPKWPYAAVLR